MRELVNPISRELGVTGSMDLIVGVNGSHCLRQWVSLSGSMDLIVCVNGSHCLSQWLIVWVNGFHCRGQWIHCLHQWFSLSESIVPLSASMTFIVGVNGSHCLRFTFSNLLMKRYFETEIRFLIFFQRNWLLTWKTFFLKNWNNLPKILLLIDQPRSCLLQL
jgi:hypothetical protein